MTNRPNPYAAAPELTQALIGFSHAVNDAGLDPVINELVKLRASQINGCAPCLHMHTASALKLGEKPMRIFLLDAWRDSSLYSERERAALGWTEALTVIADEATRDRAYEAVAAQFSPDEQVKLTLMITAINAFNRLNVGFRVPHPTAALRAEAA